DVFISLYLLMIFAITDVPPSVLRADITKPVPIPINTPEKIVLIKSDSKFNFKGSVIPKNIDLSTTLIRLSTTVVLLKYFKTTMISIMLIISVVKAGDKPKVYFKLSEIPTVPPSPKFEAKTNVFTPIAIINVPSRQKQIFFKWILYNIAPTPLSI